MLNGLLKKSEKLGYFLLCWCNLQKLMHKLGYFSLCSYNLWKLMHYCNLWKSIHSHNLWNLVLSFQCKLQNSIYHNLMLYHNLWNYILSFQWVTTTFDYLFLFYSPPLFSTPILFDVCHNLSLFSSPTPFMSSQPSPPSLFKPLL